MYSEAKVYEAVKTQANGGAAVDTESKSDEAIAIAIAEIFDDDLADFDW